MLAESAKSCAQNSAKIRGMSSFANTYVYRVDRYVALNVEPAASFLQVDAICCRASWYMDFPCFCFVGAALYATQVALEAHLRRMRQKQSVSFVSAIRKRYLDSFGSRGRFSVRESDGCNHSGERRWGGKGNFIHPLLYHVVYFRASVYTAL